MFDRLQKPFLTVETGEAYQPVRLTYKVFKPKQVAQLLDSLQCVQRNDQAARTWDWYWQNESNELHFESLDSYQRNAANPLRLASLHLDDDHLYIHLRSFKRACLAVPFFHQKFDQQVAIIHHADFINKVFATDERLPHGFSELFGEEELQRILTQRLTDYQSVQKQCENAQTQKKLLRTLLRILKAKQKNVCLMLSDMSLCWKAKKILIWFFWHSIFFCVGVNC